MDNSSLLEELECPICSDFLTIPIRQCATGHSVCGKCVIKLDKCALCQSAFTDSRNLTLEGLALKMKYPCGNKEAGCDLLLGYADREKHDLRCKFRGFQASCAMKGCDFIGDPKSLKSHWLAKKNSSKLFQTINSSSTKLKNDSYYVNMMEGFGELFWYKTKTFDNMMYFAVQFIGKPEEAQRFNFEVEFSKASVARSKILVGDYCKSIEKNDTELFKEDDCPTIGFRNVVKFAENDFLKYSLRLFKEKEGPQKNPKMLENKQKNNSEKQAGSNTSCPDKTQGSSKKDDKKKYTKPPKQDLDNEKKKPKQGNKK